MSKYTENQVRNFTPFELFTAIAVHMLTQNAKATNGTSCMYRAFDGKECAFGCVIPNSVYRAEYENRSAGQLIVPGALHEAYDHELASLFKDELKKKIINQMQYIHDHTHVSGWPDKINIAAKELFGKKKN